MVDSKITEENKNNKLIGTIAFTLVVIAIIIFTIITTISFLNERINFVSIEGTLVSYAKTESSDDSDVYVYLGIYEFEVDGQIYEFIDGERVNSTNELEEKKETRYNPDDPSDYSLTDIRLVIILWIFSGFFAFATFFLLKDVRVRMKALEGNQEAVKEVEKLDEQVEKSVDGMLNITSKIVSTQNTYNFSLDKIKFIISSIVIIFLITLIGILRVNFHLNNIKLFSDNYKETIGVAVDYNTITNNENIKLKNEPIYEYEVNNQYYNVLDSSSDEDVVLGKEAIIRYNIDDPEEAYVNISEAPSSSYVVSLAIILLFIFIWLKGYKNYKNIKQE